MNAFRILLLLGFSDRELVGQLFRQYRSCVDGALARSFWANDLFCTEPKLHGSPVRRLRPNSLNLRTSVTAMARTSWAYKGGSCMVLADANTLNAMFPGLGITLDNGSGPVHYIVTGVYP